MIALNVNLIMIIDFRRTFADSKIAISLLLSVGIANKPGLR